MRLGLYIVGVRPIKLRLKTQTATEEILARIYKPRDIAEYKDVFIKKSMNEEEKQKFKELKEAKQKNDARPSEFFFFCRVKDKIMKLYINNRCLQEKKKKRMKQLQKEVMK